MRNNIKDLSTLLNRNIKLYFRDLSTVFFSMLSMLILISLMLFFLGDNLISSISNSLAQFENFSTDTKEELIKEFVFYWSCGGILSVNAITVCIGAYSNFIKDLNSKKISRFYISPTPKFIVTMGYILAAWCISVIMCVVTFFCCEIVAVLIGFSALSLLVNLKVLSLILINSLLYSAILFCIAMNVKSDGAWNGIATIVGTLVGFLGGIYLPIGSVSQGMAIFMKFTPILYSASMFRNLMTQTIITSLFRDLPSSAMENMNVYLGNIISISQKTVYFTLQIIGFILLAITFLIVDSLAFKNKKLKDR